MKIALSIVWGMLFLLPAVSAQAKLPKVLIINSYHAEYPWVQAHNNTLFKALEGVADVAVFHMDTKRLPQEQHALMARKAFSFLRKENPDLVVLADDNALKFLGNQVSDMGISTVYLGINANPRAYLRNINQATGVLERPLLKRSIVHIKEMLGDDFKKCLVLFDSGQTSRSIHELFFQSNDSQYFEETKVYFKGIKTLDEWKQAVLGSTPQGVQVIIMGLYHTITDEQGNHVAPEVIEHWTSINSPVPVFGFWSFSIGRGKALGGFVHCGEDQGREAAAIILDCLKENKACIQPPVTARQGKFFFSRSELYRWKMSLPKSFEKRGDTIFVD